MNNLFILWVSQLEISGNALAKIELPGSGLWRSVATDTLEAIATGRYAVIQIIERQCRHHGIMDCEVLY